MTVAELMTSFPEVLDEGATIQKAAQMMRDHDYGVIPVVDDTGTLVGIVTDRDIVVQAVADGLDAGTAVGECMTPGPDTIPPDATLEMAERIMETRQIRRLPVVENGRLVGMLSLGDLAARRTSTGDTQTVLEEVSLPGGALRTPEALPEP